MQKPENAAADNTPVTPAVEEPKSQPSNDSTAMQRPETLPAEDTEAILDVHVAERAADMPQTENTAHGTAQLKDSNAAAEGSPEGVTCTSRLRATAKTFCPQSKPAILPPKPPPRPAKLSLRPQQAMVIQAASPAVAPQSTRAIPIQMIPYGMQFPFRGMQAGIMQMVSAPMGMQICSRNKQAAYTANGLQSAPKSKPAPPPAGNPPALGVLGVPKPPQSQPAAPPQEDLVDPPAKEVQLLPESELVELIQEAPLVVASQEGPPSKQAVEGGSHAGPAGNLLPTAAKKQPPSILEKEAKPITPFKPSYVDKQLPPKEQSSTAPIQADPPAKEVQLRPQSKLVKPTGTAHLAVAMQDCPPSEQAGEGALHIGPGENPPPTAADSLPPSTWKEEAKPITLGKPIKPCKPSIMEKQLPPKEQSSTAPTQADPPAEEVQSRPQSKLVKPTQKAPLAVAMQDCPPSEQAGEGAVHVGPGENPPPTAADSLPPLPPSAWKEEAKPIALVKPVKPFKPSITEIQLPPKDQNSTAARPHRGAAFLAADRTKNLLLQASWRRENGASH